MTVVEWDLRIIHWGMIKWESFLGNDLPTFNFDKHS